LDAQALNFKTLEADHEDLLMMMNEQDEIIADLKNRLRAHGEEVSSDDDDDLGI
jgi:Uso1 / p115 like vesicle tethering protein, C terminal region